MARSLKRVHGCTTMFVALMTMGITTTGYAQEAEPLLGATTKVSTLGLGGELSFAVSDHVEMMGGFNLYDHNFDFSVEDSDYAGTLNLNSWFTGIRYYPMANGLYVGGGMGLNNNTVRFSLKANDKGKFVVGDNSFDAQDVGHIKAIGNFYDIAGFGLLGFETKSPSEKGLSFFGEVGVYIAGEPRYDTDVLCSRYNRKTCDMIKSDFLPQRTKLKEKTKVMLTYPIVGFGTRIRF